MNAKMAKTLRRYTMMLTGGKTNRVSKKMVRYVNALTSEERGELRASLEADIRAHHAE